MNLVDKNFVIEVEERMVLPFEEQILASGLCDFTLPMHFRKYRGKRKISYDCSGYSTISQIQIDGPKECLEILEKTLITFNKAKEFLIDQEKIVLNLDTVFFHKKYRNVKIAYLPQNRTRPIKEIIQGFVEGLKENCDGQSGRFLDRIVEEIFTRNLNIPQSIDYIGEIRRELYSSGLI